MIYSDPTFLFRLIESTFKSMKGTDSSIPNHKSLYDAGDPFSSYSSAFLLILAYNVLGGQIR